MSSCLTGLDRFRAAVALYGGIAVVVLGATRAWWRWLLLTVPWL